MAGNSAFELVQVRGWRGGLEQFAAWGVWKLVEIQHLVGPDLNLGRGD